MTLTLSFHRWRGLSVGADFRRVFIAVGFFTASAMCGDLWEWLREMKEALEKLVNRGQP